MEIAKLMKSKTGSIVIAIILGLGLAAAFRKSCGEGKCIVIKGPKMADVQGHTYRIADKCYKYTPFVVECEKDSLSV
jgi:hypothetical protein